MSPSGPPPDTAGPSQLLREAARRAPARTALIDATTTLTWSELDRGVTAASLALSAAGAAPGDRVSLQLPTGADFVACYLGALRAGLVAVPVNPAYTNVEVEHVRRDCGAVLHLDPAAARELLSTAPSGDDPRADRDGEHLAALMYTSGTAGRSKGAMLTARALRANLDQLAAVSPALLTEDDVLFAPLPLTHIFGLNAGLGMALRVAATLVLADRFDPGATLGLMRAHGVTALLGVPGQYAAWLAHPDMHSGFAGVRFAMSGSTTLTRGIIDGFAAAGVIVHDGYGLTEAAPVVAINAIDATGMAGAPAAVGSVGVPLPGVEVELRDSDGDEVDDGDPGRIFVRGANLFSGYWPDGADGPDDDGWFGTGDVAICDAEGRLRLVGRSSELVIVNGFNVYPAEVEAVLAREPGVAEVAVVGVRDERSGEAVRAYVVPVAGSRLDTAVLTAAAARSLARFKVPTTIELVDALPRTVTGKIMKWQLDREAADGAA